MRLDVNGKTRMSSLDCYHPTVVAADITLPNCRLRNGKNSLRVTILGANPAAVKSHMFGLDYILAEKLAQ